MAFYLLLFLLIFLCALLVGPTNSRHASALFVLFSMSVLGGVAALRAPSVGVDTFQYVSYYPVLGSLDWGDYALYRYEPGFFALCKILYTLSPNPQILVLVSSVFVSASVGLFIQRFSVDPFMSVFLYLGLQLFAMNMNVMRQATAMGIMLFFFPLLTSRKFWPVFALGVIVAAQFHTAAWLYMVMLLCPHLRFRWRNLFWFLLVSIAAGVAVRRLLVSMSALQDGPYLAYTDTSGEVSGKIGTILLFGLYTALCVIQFISASGARAERDSSNGGDEGVARVLLNSASLTIPASALAVVSYALLRFGYAFAILFVCSLPLAISMNPNARERTMLRIAIYVGVGGFFIATSLLRPEWFGVVPYSSVIV